MVTAATRFVPPSLHVDALLIADDGVIFRTNPDTTSEPCPVCGESADRTHIRATPRLADLPWANFVIHLQLQVR